MTENTLERNKVDQFILRIDLPRNSQIDIRQLALDLEGEYTRLIKNSEHNFNLNMDTNEVMQRDFINYDLIAEDGIKLTLLAGQKVIALESRTYIDNRIYIDRLKSIIEKINDQGLDNVVSSRIGMRFINIFPCEKKEHIKKILQRPNDKVVCSALEKEKLNRAVIVEQYNFNDYFVKVQYGVFNKFYPAEIKNTDITLDIDVYFGGLVPISEWSETIQIYNHAAFDMFKSYVDPSYLESMR